MTSEEEKHLAELLDLPPGNLCLGCGHDWHYYPCPEKFCLCYKSIDLAHITWILERFRKALEKQSAVVEAARKLRDSLLDEKTGMWETAILKHLDQTQIHSLHNLGIVLDALEEK
mgnify:CR=1 FL=1